MKKILPGLLILCALPLLWTCSENPVTGETELSLISPEQEIAIGQANYQPSQQAQGGEYYIDPGVQDYVREVGSKLAAVSDRELPYEFVVLNNSVPNAWALPGGKIAINRGLLSHLEDECELAAVLGHEIVHAAARHSASQMTRGTFLGIGAQVLGIALADKDYGQLAGTAAQVGAAAWMARYGREAELEADAYGMRYMSRAGYDPEGAVRLQKTFVELSKDRKSDFLSGLFASHPPSEKRVEANRELAATLPAGDNCQAARYQAAMEQIQEDQPAYALQEKAIAALEAKKPEDALGYLDEAIDRQPAEGYFWELRGHAHKMQKEPEKAEKDFTRAIERNPELFSHYLSRGVLRYEQGDKRAAKEDLQRSHELLPTQVSSYLLGELALAADNPDAALQYYESAAGSGGKLGEKAVAKITRLQLPEMPHKYLPSQAYLGRDGYLRIAVRNQTNLEVAGVAVRLEKLADAYTVTGSRILRVPGVLRPGQQVSLRTGVGPFENAEQARYFRAVVVAARPVAEAP